jgi:hypothetical protein
LRDSGVHEGAIDMIVKLTRKEGDAVKKSFMECIEEIIESKDIDLMLVKLSDIEDNLIMEEGDMNVVGWDWEDALHRYTEGKVRLLKAIDSLRNR